jgi:serine/threonine protein kinase
MIDETYELIKIIGKGGSSKVFLAQDDSQNYYAIKALRKDKNLSAQASKLVLEREHDLLLRLADHPNIINTILTWHDGTLNYREESEKVWYNVLEYAKNGAVSKFIRYTGAIEELLVRPLFLQLWSGIDYMHAQGYAHLDVKLENILLDEFFNIKLADLGSSVDVSSTSGLTNRRRGTQMYMSPEVVDLKLGDEFNAFKADVYWLGITLYVLLVGDFPSPNEIWNYDSTNDSEVNSNLDYNKPVTKSKWDQLSNEAKQLIISMTHRDADKRPSISELLNWEWLGVQVYPETMQDLYKEMYCRKEFIERELKVSI